MRRGVHGLGLVIIGLAAACSRSGRNVAAESEQLSREGDESELVRARQELRTLVDTRRHSADPAGLAQALEALAVVTDALGDRTEARPIFDEALTLEHGLGAAA